MSSVNKKQSKILEVKHFTINCLVVLIPTKCQWFKSGIQCLVIETGCMSVAVLLRALLGHHPLPAWARVPQAAGQGGG